MFNSGRERLLHPDPCSLHSQVQRQGLLETGIKWDVHRVKAIPSLTTFTRPRISVPSVMLETTDQSRCLCFLIAGAGEVKHSPIGDHRLGRLISEGELDVTLHY